MRTFADKIGCSAFGLPGRGCNVFGFERDWGHQPEIDDQAWLEGDPVST